MKRRKSQETLDNDYTEEPDQQQYSRQVVARVVIMTANSQIASGTIAAVAGIQGDSGFSQGLAHSRATRRGLACGWMLNICCTACLQITEKRFRPVGRTRTKPYLGFKV